MLPLVGVQGGTPGQLRPVNTWNAKGASWPPSAGAGTGPGARAQAARACIRHGQGRLGDNEGRRRLAKAIWLSRWRNVAGGDVPDEWDGAARSVSDHDATYGPMFRMRLGMLTSPPEPVELRVVLGYHPMSRSW